MTVDMKVRTLSQMAAISTKRVQMKLVIQDILVRETTVLNKKLESYLIWKAFVERVLLLFFQLINSLRLTCK